MQLTNATLKYGLTWSKIIIFPKSKREFMNSFLSLSEWIKSSIFALVRPKKQLQMGKYLTLYQRYSFKCDVANTYVTKCISKCEQSSLLF